MALPVTDGQFSTRIGTARTVAPTTTKPATIVSPVPASQPKTQLYQAVNGSVWRWNPQANQWQMVQSTPSVATPYAPQLVGTITKPIPGQPGAFVTVKNTANPTAPGQVFLPNVSAPITIPAGPDATPPAPVITNNIQPPSHAASFNPPPIVNIPSTVEPFFAPSQPVGLAPTPAPVSASQVSINFSFPILVILAFLAIYIFGGHDAKE